MNWQIVIIGFVSCTACCHRQTRGAQDACGAGMGNLEAALAPRSAVIFGEIHGTKEIPRFIGSVVCEVSRLGPVVLGLEMPGDDHSLDAFLASDGGTMARRTLLSGPFWRRQSQDGRSSLAMFELIDQMRTLRAGGREIEVLPFDAETTGDTTRDQLMAMAIAQKRRLSPDSRFILLMGNLHARKTTDQSWGSEDYAWVASLLPFRAISLNMVHVGVGSAWVCTGNAPSSCGPVRVSPSSTFERGIVMKPSSDQAYDGAFGVASLTASAPAASVPQFSELDAGAPGRP